METQKKEINVQILHEGRAYLTLASYCEKYNITRTAAFIRSKKMGGHIAGTKIVILIDSPPEYNRGKPGRKVKYI